MQHYAKLLTLTCLVTRCMMQTGSEFFTGYTGIVHRGIQTIQPGITEQHLVSPEGSLTGFRTIKTGDCQMSVVETTNDPVGYFR